MVRPFLTYMLYCLLYAHYTEKLSPQPQVRVALGLLNVKPLPSKPPENSMVVLKRYKKLFRSVTTLTPLSSNTWSDGFDSLSKSILYDNPEQPPEVTLTRMKKSSAILPDCLTS